MAEAPTSDGPAVPRAAVSSVRLFALCLVASVVASTLPLPFAAAAVVFLVVGLVAGVRALVGLVGAGGRGGLVAVVGCLIALSVLLLVGEIGRLALWPVTWDFQECRQAAITESGREQCQTDYEQDLTDLIGTVLRPTTS